MPLPPQVAKNGSVCPTSLQWIYQRRDRLHFAVFSLLGLHFLAFWPCRLSFPCILALWAFISLHFGLVGFHFLSFWPFRGQLLGLPPPQVAKNCPFALLHFAVFSLLGLHFLAFWPCGPSFPCILALWAFISLHFGLVGLRFLSFWPFRGQLLGPRPTSCQKWPVCPTSSQWIYQRRDRLHFAVFSLLGLHFLAFWPCGPSFLCILALWAFISLHFGLVGRISFPFILAISGSACGGPPHKLPKWPVCPTSLQWIYQRRDRLHFAVFSLLDLHFLAFFGLVGLHFLAFWPCGPSFPCILAL